ncbi:MAG: divergent polysaccharide deacetylase family protein [Elusimicrobiota bacterium]
MAAKKKKSKRANKYFSAFKILGVILCLFSLYAVYRISTHTDLTDISLNLEKTVNIQLIEHGVDSSDIIEKYQTEKKSGNTSWIEYTKKIRIARSRFSGLKKKLESIARTDSLDIKDVTSDTGSPGLDIGIEGFILNSIRFELVEDKNRVAIVVDDLGYTKNIQAFIELDIPVTYAILPGLKYSNFLAKELKRSGLPFILHMPMEPEGYPGIDPGEIALLTDMDEEKIEKTLDRALESVEGAPGLNNHMGSRFTSNPEKMRILLEILKRKGLFFVDSATSNNTTGFKTASELGVRTAKNSFYIDNKDDYDYIMSRLEKLKRTASSNMKTVAICHITRKNTVKALAYFLEELKKADIEFVTVEELLE